MSKNPEPQKTSKGKQRGRPPISDEKRKFMRHEIAVCAENLFQAEGYGQVSMRRIANEIGCSPMTLYKYYDAKIDILRTLWSDVFSLVFDKLDALSATQMKPNARLAALSSAYVKYWLDHTEHYRLVFMAEGVTQPDVSLFMDDPKITLRFQVLADAVLAANSDADRDDHKQKLDALLCFLHGIAHNLITISGYSWSAHDDLIDIALSGIIGPTRV